MKKLLSLIMCMLLTSSIGAFYACDKNGGDTQSSSSSSAPPVVVQPIYNIKVDVTLKEYGGDDVPVADAIEQAASTVYGLKASAEGMEVYGSAVAVMTGELHETEDDEQASQTQQVPENTRYFTYFVTCLNLLEEAEEYELTSLDGQTYTAEFIGADPNTNVAILSVEQKLGTATIISDSDDVRLGDEMFAMGFPFNAGTGVLKMTTLGAKQHDVNVGMYTQKLMVLSDELNLGYTGGAAYAVNGAVAAGIITSYDGLDTDGYSFIIPANVAVEIAKGLVTTYSQENFGYIEGNFVLGMAVENATLTSTPYVYISALDQTGSLYLGGMRVGDRITRIGYTPKDGDDEASFAEVTTKDQLEAFIAGLDSLAVGDSLHFRYVRDKMSLSRTVQIKQYIYGTDYEVEK